MKERRALRGSQFSVRIEAGELVTVDARLLFRGRATLSSEARGADVLIGPGLLAALCLFPVAISVPLLKTKIWFSTSSVISLCGAVYDLYQIDWWLFAIVALTGLVLPVSKMVLATMVWYRTDISIVSRYSSVLSALSKFSMLDVMLLALIVVAFKGVGVGKVEVEYGLYVYSAFVVICLFLSVSMAGAINKFSKRNAGPALFECQHPSHPTRGTLMTRLSIGVALLLGGIAIGYFALTGGSAVWQGITALSLGDVLKNPKAYDGKSITVKGKVVDSAGLMGFGGYLIKDGEAEIYVIGSKGIPTPGTDVTVYGTFKQALAVGPIRYSVIIEK